MGQCWARCAVNSAKETLVLVVVFISSREEVERTTRAMPQCCSTHCRVLARQLIWPFMIDLRSRSAEETGSSSIRAW